MNPNLSPLMVKAPIIICCLCCFCNPGPRGIPDLLPAIAIHGVPGINPYPSIGAIPLPPGYRRIPADSNSFAAWLRILPLKKDRTVRLYNGSPREDQETQFAVLDVSVGTEDLQQCADAVMRLRAEYLYSQKAYGDIEFRTTPGRRLNYKEWAAGKRCRCSDRKCFWGYLQFVFRYCGTLSLEQQLGKLPANKEMQVGDVFIKGGSPGHAMLVADMAGAPSGKKVFLLAQGYMPAQDIHIVKNLMNYGLSPWYNVDYEKPVHTPGWVFYDGQLRCWPKKSENLLR